MTINSADLIDRVAKGLRAKCGEIESLPGNPRPDVRWFDDAIAEAAITAIHPGLLDGSAVVMPKEPTVAMREAFVAVLPDLSLVVAGYGYRAMRDAYLATPPSPAEKPNE